MEQTELSNGIQIIHAQNTFSKVGHIGVFIGVGSRDEVLGEEGVAHYLEHVIFKGTKKRKAYHVLSRLDAVGGELNAYTTKEETCVYASFPVDYLSRSIELLSDVLFNSNFPKQELEKEKEVVIDEINSYRDSPSDLIFDEFDKYLFKGNPLGNDILGTEQQVQSISRKTVTSFVKKHYVTQNLVISSVGNYSIQKLKKQIEKYFSHEANVSSPNKKRVCPQKIPLNDIVLKKNLHQTHTMLGGRGYSANHNNRPSLLLANNILGGPAMNSRLNLNIREKHGLTYMLESNCVMYSDCGSFSVYFGTDNKNTAKTEKLVRNELQKLCDKKLGTLQLSQAKKQVKGQLAISMENSLGVMLAHGKSMLLFNKVDSLDQVLKEFEAIDASQILDVANEVMAPSKLFKISYY
ncbi:MAG: peptidase M16 [Flavobacteriales bacterium]|nr:peptidase M16 [Flavobacteriales bacterium]|tara:strand:- start:45644 stop:46864 length:1221 start_codon:yes stop_codon:yes gene_type:complete